MSRLTISVALQGDRHADQLAKRLADIERECADQSKNPYQKTDFTIRAVQDAVKGYLLDTELTQEDFAVAVQVKTI